MAAKTLNEGKPDVQGLIVRSHQEMGHAAYVLLQFQDADRVRAWLREVLPLVTRGDQKPLDRRFQLAFTFPGMAFLGAEDYVDHGFAVEFIQGMDADFRTRILGDEDGSAPENWRWGSRHQAPLHALALLFAPDGPALTAWIEDVRAQAPGAGFQVLDQLLAPPNPAGVEHFGFRDGISQPTIRGLVPADTKAETIADGEFVMGYPNGYDELPDSPRVPTAKDPEGKLPGVPGQPEWRDLGHNGSYLVFRQLKQNVSLFWEQIADAVQQETGTRAPEACMALGAKMVGRWPNGNSLVEFPETGGPARSRKEQNDFRFGGGDEDGMRCPLGSHIRRSNPRDQLPDNSPESSVRISNLHRILRRGRLYGAPLAPDVDPRKMIDRADDGVDRGLYFICFNSNISRQFEFIQHTWCLNPKFGGLYNDPDPVLGIKDAQIEAPGYDFTIPAHPIRRKLTGLRRAVHTVGGAYFFMPGLRALHFIAHYQPLPT